MAAIIFIVGIIFFVGLLPAKHIARFSLLLLGYTVMGLVYFFFTPDYSLINHYLFLLTISAFLLLVMDLRPLASAPMLEAISKLVNVALLTQTSYALIQGGVAFSRLNSFDRSAGDFIRGTIEPGFGPTFSASNQMFAILITTLLLYALATQRSRLSLRQLFLYGFTIVAWLMTSVFHTFLFLGAAASLSIVIRWRLRSTRIHFPQLFLILSGLILIIIFITYALPNNLSNLSRFTKITFDLERGSYKTLATYNTFVYLPQDRPAQPLLGLGPGHYSSRAALIRSGEYISGTTIPLPAFATEASNKYILSLWRTFFLRYPNGGSTFFPFYSWLSLYGEFGFIGLMVVGFAAGRTIFQWRFTKIKAFPYMPQAIITMVLYILFLGFQDNYWEFVQAITPAILFLTLARAHVQRVVAG
ncbi:MAG: hypothetical protein IPJ90_16690 [Anaerolineaceae bacterium]|nr:hypothetical protein [Anaerolineaceae bacterium]